MRLIELAAQHVAGMQPLQQPHLCCQRCSRRLCGSHAICLAASCGQLVKACATATDPVWLQSLICKGSWLPHRRLVYGAHFYDGFYVQPLWQLLGEGVTCALMTGFLDSRVAVLLNEVTQTLSLNLNLNWSP